jgi:hypothetical protein
MGIDAQNKVDQDIEGAYAELQALVVRMARYGYSEDAIDYARDAIISLDKLVDCLDHEP